MSQEPAKGRVVRGRESEAALADVVAGFLAEGVTAGQPGLVIATASHAAAFRARMSALAVDVEAAVEQGRLRFVDAGAMLDELLVDGVPDRARFDAKVGAALEQTGAAGGPVRVYGEMVDILWGQGRASAALLLQEMWKDLATAGELSLLDAHPTGSRMPALEAEVRERQRLEAALRQCLANQQRVEAELRERNEELNEFLENAVDGLHWIAPDGAILSANPAILALLGYSWGEYVGRHMADFHVDADVAAGILHRLARNDRVRDCDARLRCRDGSIKHVRINSNARFRDGKLVHIGCLIRDVTAEKRALEETSRLMEALVQAGGAKDEFIATLSHELRGPLAPIRSALQLMQLRGDSGVTKEREIVDRQVGTLVRLVDDLLDASRIAARKIELQRERLDVADVVEMAVEIAGPVLDARGHTVHVRAGQGIAFVDGDPVRLAQVVSNLLFNAAKYTERNGRVSVDVRVDGGNVVVSVRDTGIGIEGDLLPHVFERGVQGGHGIAGLGLGLAIVRALVELHGGAISAHSDGRGRGSEFRVMLPLAEPHATEDRTAPGPEAPVPDAASPTRVLIVDDDADLADTMAELLALRGFVIRVARDGAEAVHAFAQFRPQAALIDIALPIMNGLELARRLREIGTDAKLIALSGYGRREDEEASLAAGFDLHLVKPVRPDLIDAHLRGLDHPGRALPARDAGHRGTAHRERGNAAADRAAR